MTVCLLLFSSVELSCFVWKPHGRYEHVCRSIYTYLVILCLFRSLSIRESAYVNACLVQIISHLNTQIKFQMLTIIIFSGHHVGVHVPQRYTSMAALYWAL